MVDPGTRVANLSLDGLEALPSNVARPSYDRASLSAGILHIGIGNFHRAHQAVYLDRLFSAGRDHDWAIVGAGVMPGDARTRDVLASQDYLTTVVEQSADQSEARVTAPMIDFLPAADSAAIVSGLSDPSIRIASMTITEGGYYLDASGHFDPKNPAILAEVASDGPPKTVFGMIVDALKQRRDNGEAPFTVMSCDNIPHNGLICQEAVTGTAKLIDPDLASWIEDSVSFPNGMVDRITPATSDRERAILLDGWGIEDAWPVFCEDFSQWVLEDAFTLGRPALEDVGVEFVSDVTPYESMKIRILNGGHAIIAYASALLDIEYVHEGMANPLVRAFLSKVEREEVIPILPPVPNTDLEAYYAKIERRCLNPKIADTIRRLCFDGSNRQPKFIIPSIADRLARGLPMEGLALESALWCRYCHGATESGAEIAPNDPSWERLTTAAHVARENPVAWLEMRDIYGDVGQAEPFRASFTTALNSVWSDGVETALRQYTAS